MSETASATIGLGPLRPPPDGLPDPDIAPPVIAETGDPFTAIRVIDLLARLERGTPARLADIVDRLNATYLDWLFTAPVVADVALQLQANWMADYRSGSGILLDAGDRGDVLTVQDTARMDPWLVGQAERLAAEAREALRSFARRDTAYGGG